MRVTSQTFPNVLVGQLSTLAQRQNKLQNQAATGQRIQFPEDDPTSMRRVLDLQSESVNIGQYRNNIQRLQEQSKVGYATIRSMKTLVDRASEVATLADGTKSQDELDTYAIEIEQLLRSGLQLVNSQHRGDYLFSGTRSDVESFTFTEDANGRVNSATYLGNQSLASSEIAEKVTTTTMTLGENNTGTGARGLVADSRTGADLFNHLIALRDNLLAGNVNAISTTNLKELGKDEDNFLFHFGTVGSIQARLEAAESIFRSRSESVEGLVSKEADVDLADTLVRLNQTQNAYKAALQSGGTILNQSLLDFLR
jgi:flagellar hook-associated protein 3 FlgL